MTYKFRGYDKVGKKGWVYGDLVHSKGISPDPKIDLYDRTMVAGYEVFPESVGIFTGCTDSEGNEIYEGDIIDVKFPSNYAVRQRKAVVTWYRYKLVVEEEDGIVWDLSFIKYMCTDLHVVGTAFEKILEKKTL